MRVKVTLFIVLTLVLFEVYVRLFVVSPAVVRFDTELGPMKAPYSHILRTYEGHGEYSNDKYGFNNDPLPLHMPIQRLLVLGDSFVEAKHVFREQGFVARLNALPDVLAYNAGYSGADPRSFPILAKRFVPVLHPTQLIVCVNADDLTALSSASLPRYDAPTGPKAWLQPLFSHSALATHLNWKYKPIVQSWWQKLWQQEPSQVQAYQESVYVRHWASILDELLTHHIPILLVALPKLNYERGQAKVEEDERLEAMVRVARRKHVSVLRLEGVLKEDFIHTKQVAYGFMNSHLGTGHLNEHGHAVLAHSISSALRLAD